MKLNKEQRQVVAKRIYNEVENSFIAVREAELQRLMPEIDALYDEIVSHDWDCQYSKQGLRVKYLEIVKEFTINGKTHRFNDTYVNKNFNKNELVNFAKRKINQEFAPKILAGQIEDDLIFASFEAENLDGLILSLVAKYKYK